MPLVSISMHQVWWAWSIVGAWPWGVSKSVVIDRQRVSSSAIAISG
jgi:hypothetical protein